MVLAHRRRHRRDNRSAARMVSAGGNSPWNKPAVFQAGQFLFHGAYPILGYL